MVINHIFGYKYMQKITFSAIFPVRKSHFLKKRIITSLNVLTKYLSNLNKKG